MNSDDFDRDRVLQNLAAARQQRDDADRIIRQLVAYGREFVRPRPYTLAALAAASGMSISGVRTCYGANDITAVAERLGTNRQQPPAREFPLDEVPLLDAEGYLSCGCHGTQRDHTCVPND